MDVAVVVYDGVFDSGLAAILDVLSNANALGNELHQAPTWDVTMVGPSTHVRTGAGLLVSPEPLEHARSADLLVVPALAESRPSALLDHVGGDVSLPVRDLIAKTHKQGTPIASACAGTFLLAEAGILDGVRATTTWWLSPAFRARYPRVELDHGHMVVTSGSITTAGAAFGHIDLALSIIRSGSPALAHRRHVAHPLHPGPEDRTRHPPAAHHRPVGGDHRPESRLRTLPHPARALAGTDRQDRIGISEQEQEQMRRGDGGRSRRVGYQASR
ncbi:DJ-1/PfpI family protein [Actinospica durhamensis]|uniref:DJ-1/PfpI family protein n=1 Tax=Actinospica durhamensis TaxID=1508375 RepID=A0A941ES43_9ACTN|nr:DJ-1/PfpI family protein [Actinospica durhamensis]MBR7837395.1 DJ-1/PfpI family protein [Actinospica durhamensis]